MKNDNTMPPKRRLGQWKAPEHCPGCDRADTFGVAEIPSVQIMQGEELAYTTEKYACASCGAEWMSPAQATAGVAKAVSVFQKKHGLLTAKEVRARRSEIDWTQEDLARESGVSIATVKRLESGVHVIGKLYNDTLSAALAEALAGTMEPDYEFTIECTDFTSAYLPVPSSWNDEEPWNNPSPWTSQIIGDCSYADAADSNQLALAV